MNHAVPASIMVIGTDLHFCYLMRRFVRESAHRLLFATPDENAFEVAQREKPALIVLEDVQADSKSRQILKTLKSNEVTCQIPVALCSWHEEDLSNDEERPDIFLRMPILYGDFLAVINDLGI